MVARVGNLGSLAKKSIVAFDICESLKFTFSVAINNMVSEKQHDLPSSFKNDIALKTMQILIEITRNIFRNRKKSGLWCFFINFL